MAARRLVASLIDNSRFLLHLILMGCVFLDLSKILTSGIDSLRNKAKPHATIYRYSIRFIFIFIRSRGSYGSRGLFG